MPAERNRIVNADDFGLSAGVNAGILEAHERGIVTSTSLMVRKPAAGEAASLAASHPSLAIGLHLDLGQWDYEQGEWKVAYENCPPDDPAAVDAECRAQVDAFRALLGRDPTHLDSHQHAHEEEPLSSVATTLAAELGVPLRGRLVSYEGGFYGQSGRGEPYPEGITTAHLTRMIAGVRSGWTEFGCHPGIGVEAESSYAGEREIEVAVLCDPLVSEAIDREGVRLRSFAELE
jgi:predicted glycoside hydrolase/deacetylase ChbG (UPF0249 family)